MVPCLFVIKNSVYALHKPFRSRVKGFKLKELSDTPNFGE